MKVKILILALVLVLALSALVVTAASKADKEKPCVAQPAQDLGIAAITEGIGFIMAGGIGPILMLVIAFVIGMLVSHAVWTSF